MTSLVTTISEPKIINEILEEKDFQADEVIMLAKKGMPSAKEAKKGFKVVNLEGNFHDILKRVKTTFSKAKDPFFIAGENELDIYITYYLTQFHPSTPFYALDQEEPVLLPTSPNRGFISTKEKILEILKKKSNVTIKYVQDQLNRMDGKTKGNRKKYSETTVYQYLHELENMGLISIEIKRNKKYSINKRGLQFMELLS